MYKWQKQKDARAVKFFKEFIAKVLSGRFRIFHFGVWSAGQRGKYGVSLYFNDIKELEK